MPAAMKPREDVGADELRAMARQGRDSRQGRGNGETARPQARGRLSKPAARPKAELAGIVEAGPSNAANLAPAG